MQLIKDFSDIQKIVVLLSSDNQEKLLVEINTLLVNYINEQNKPALEPVSNVNSKPALEPVASVQINPLERFINEQDDGWNENHPSIDQAKPTLSPISSITPKLPDNVSENIAINPFTDFQAGSVSKPLPPGAPAAGINALKSSFAKSPNMPLPPPPPPLPNLPPQSVPVGRSIAAGNLNLKSSFGNKPGGNKPTSLTIIDLLGYIVPILTDEGKDALKNPATQTDVYQLLKAVNGESNLKHIQMFLFPELAYGKYLEKVYALSRERCLNFRKTPGFPAETEMQIRVGDLLISMGIINETNLERALQVQKEPPKLSVTSDVEVPSWIEKAKSMIQQEAASQPVKKKLIGDTLVDLGMITKDQLVSVLSLQRWLRNLIEHI